MGDLDISKLSPFCFHLSHVSYLVSIYKYSDFCKVEIKHITSHGLNTTQVLLCLVTVIMKTTDYILFLETKEFSLYVSIHYHFIHHYHGLVGFWKIRFDLSAAFYCFNKQLINLHNCEEKEVDSLVVFLNIKMLIIIIF